MTSDSLDEGIGIMHKIILKPLPQYTEFDAGGKDLKGLKWKPSVVNK
jgi:hypothetical protein